MYNVQDLVVWTTSFGRCQIPDQPEGCAQLERRAKEAVAEAPWDDGVGWTLVFQNGLLIVRADELTQGAVRTFLASERTKKK